MKEQLHQVTAPHFCAGILCMDNKIRRTAPILCWARSKHLDWFMAYCERKGWKMELVESEPATTQTEMIF
jgi:hypothetical protein